MHTLAPSSEAALAGVASPWELEIDGGQLHTELVMRTKLQERLCDELTATIATPTDLYRAFVDDEQQIKAVVEFARLDDISGQ